MVDAGAVVVAEVATRTKDAHQAGGVSTGGAAGAQQVARHVDGGIGQIVAQPGGHTGLHLLCAAAGTIEPDLPHSGGTGQVGQHLAHGGVEIGLGCQQGVQAGGDGRRAVAPSQRPACLGASTVGNKRLHIR